ncbi:MAG: hypothetical protein DWP98_03025 [Bacteroidetes bacterium]|nr:MAG: hypothetical protein DWP98_03025 [Bacteroidota bacterium]MBL1144264.1 hypothetical protein [Bacteroidota bacterium]MCB0801799.1 hypothetical protein [Flavobacteriales bacterium]NOG57060.1 hypothetical protein [Bacteroidota bacterium]
MKKSIYYSIIAILAVVTFAFKPISGDTSCDSKALKKEGITSLDPFYYSSSKVSTITYDYRAQRKEIEVPLFKGEKYKMVFNKKGLPKDVIVEVYDKDKDHNGRTPIFTSEGKDGNIISFEPEKSKKMYVNYIVPASKGTDETGCLVFVLGYQLTFIKKTDADSAE